MRRPLALVPLLGALLLGLILGSADAATLYKWVDENGVVHYSDQPQPGAEKIHVNNAQTYKGGAPTPSGGSGQKPPPGRSYTRVAVTTPIPEQVFVNTGGSVPVSASVEPGLQPGHQVYFLLDGSRVQGLAPNSTAATLDNIDRGEHTVAVQVADQNGIPVLTSDPVTFYVRAPSEGKAPRGPGIAPPPMAHTRAAHGN